MRKYASCHRAQTRAPMTTEYQDRFLPPHYHMAMVSTTTQKKPYHSLKGTSNDVPTFRSFYVTARRIKHPPKPPQLKAPQPSLPPKVHERCSSAPHEPARFPAKRMAPKLEDYTSVYKNDFRAWTNKHQSCRLSDGLKVNQRLAVKNFLPEGGHSHKDPAQVEANTKPVPQKKDMQPSQSITSYRSDYVAHPLPPRTQREKPVYQTNKVLPLGPAPSFTQKVAWDRNQELSDGASELLKHFSTWSLKAKFHSQGKDQVSSPRAVQTFLSTMHADYIPHKCQRTKPILPAMEITETSKKPFQAMTTMRQDYKAWDTLRHVPVRTEEMEQKKNHLSVCGPTPAQSCKTNSKPCDLNSKTDETTVCNSSCNAAEEPQRPAENQTLSGFHCISSGKEESRMFWSTCLDRGASAPDDDDCEDPSQAHQMISCMVSSKS